MPRLTKRLVDSAEIHPKDYFIWDSDLPGFGIRIFGSGRKSYLVQYRTGRRTRRITLGKHGALTPDEARKEARQILAAVARGADPAEEAKRERHSPTVGDLCNRFLNEHVDRHTKPKTAEGYRVLIRRFIRPRLGTFRVSDVTRADVAALHAHMNDRPYQANRAVAVLSKMFNLSEQWGWRPEMSNPCKYIKPYAEKKRERFLSPEEISRLGQVLRQVEQEGSETASAILAIRLLLLTGCRMNEVLTLKWEHVKGDRLRLPDSKTGAKTIFLGPEAMDLLQRAQRVDGNEYVIVGRADGKHLHEIQRPWRRIRARAGLNDVRLHDLRHSFASVAVAHGESLPVIGKLLGHAQPQTTAQYAHLAEDPTQGAAARISSRIAGFLKEGIHGVD